MTSATLLIKDGSHHSAKESSKLAFGKLLSATFPQRTREIYRSPGHRPCSFIDRGILYHLKHRAIGERRDKFLNRLHTSFWAGDEGSVFSDNCDYRFRDNFVKKQKRDFEALSQLWSDQKSIRNIVEIGTCSGLLLRYLQDNLDGTQSVVGIDINDAQIQKNRSNYDGNNIEFHCANGLNWVKQFAVANTMFVTNGGVLEYFTQEDLTNLFGYIAKELSPAIFYCSEPIAADYDLNSQGDSKPFGDELSFSHNYPHLLSVAGFELVSQREVQCEQYRMLTTIAVTE